MLKASKKCAVCLTIKQEAGLLNFIFHSSFYVRGSTTTLKTITDQYKGTFSYPSLLNHVKKHQFMNQKDFTDRTFREIAKASEAEITKRRVESTEVWDDVLQTGLPKIQDGSIPLKAQDVLKAAKDKSDFELKVKDQQLAMLDMIAHFASGENNESKSYDRRIVEGQTVENHNSTERPTANLEQGADGPSGIHYPPAWDATP